MTEPYSPYQTPSIIDGDAVTRLRDRDVSGGRLRVLGRKNRMLRRKEAAERKEFRESLGLPGKSIVPQPDAKPEVREMRPEEDFSRDAIRTRERERFQGFLREFMDIRRTPDMGPGPAGFSDIHNVAHDTYYNKEQRYSDLREKYVDIWKHRGESLEKFPVIARAVAEAQASGADISEQDIIRTLNFAEIDRAANLIVNNMWDTQLVTNVLYSSDDITRAAILDLIPVKLKEVEKLLVDLETADSNVTIDAAGRVVGEAVGGLTQIWDKGQQLFRAFGYRDEEEAAANPLYDVAGGIFVPLRVPFNWDKVAPGKFNTKYIESIRRSGVYTDTEINVLLDMALAGEEGSSDPIGDTIQRYIDDPEGLLVIRRLIYRYDEDSRLGELARQIDSAKQGSTGQLFTTLLTSFNDEYSEWRGSQLRGVMANTASVFWAFAADPIIVGAAVRSSYLAAKFTMQSMTGTKNVDKALASQKVLGVERNGFRTYVQRFTDDLKKYDEMKAIAAERARQGADPKELSKLRGDAADFRQSISRNYKEFPEDVIDTFQKAGVRNVDDFGQFVKDGNNAMRLLRGDAPNLADTSQLFAVTKTSPGRGGPQPTVDFATFAERLTAAGFMGRREAMVPRMTIGKQLRQQFVRAMPHRMMPKRRGRAAIEEFYQGTDDAELVVQALNKHYDKIGVMDQMGGPIRWASLVGGLTGTTGKMMDTVFRRFASLPNKNFIYTGDARDAKTFYQFARQYFTKYHATYLTDIFRESSEGTRRLLVMGLVRGAASSRGVRLSESQAMGRFGGEKGPRSILESMTTGSADDLYAPQILQSSKFGQQRAREYGDDLARFFGDSEEVVLNPSVFGDRQHALHLAQTTPYVSIPGAGQIEALRWYRMYAPKWIQALEKSPQAATDFWSLFTLYGFRYSQRNMIEDLWMYMMTRGRVGNLFVGRRMSTALRDARPALGFKKDDLGNVVFKRDEAGNMIPEIVVTKQRVGMFAKKSRDFGNWLRRNDTEMQRTLSSRVFGTFFLGAVADEQTLAKAYLSAQKGDLVPMQRLAIAAITRQRLTGVTKQQVDDLGDLVLNPMGLKLLEDLAETGRYITQGSFPAKLGAVPGTDELGVITYAVPDGAQTVGGKFISMPPTDPNGSLYWFRSLNSVVDFDGPIGEIAIKNLNNRERAVETIAKVIREDKTIGYKERLSAFYELNITPEQFAYRYFDDVFNTFSKKDGKINQKLWDIIAPLNPTTKQRVVSLTDPDGTLRVTPQSLRAFGEANSPQYVLGREQQVIPTAGKMDALLGSNWRWMGEQYARIAREPIFLGNYLEQRDILRAYQASLAKDVGEEAAKKTVAKIATERAYWFTLNYVDNPRNRSQLAWKVRNVSRYYRATEDFYRRIQRVAVNYPEGLWKTALTYQILDDTGFVYTDENGNKFFAYPGNEQLLWVVNEVLGRIVKPGTSGVGTLPGNFTFDPFMIGGRVTNLAPSFDPQQTFAPSVFSAPLAALSAKTLFEVVPSAKALERYILGEYGQDSSYWDLVLPAGIARVLRIVDPDEASSTIHAATMDALSIAVAEDLLPATAEDGSPLLDPGQITRTDAFETLSTIATSAVVVRSIMGFAVPAAPQLYVNNTSEFARQRGWPSMRAGFYKLMEQYKDEPDPVKAAFRAWWRLHPDGKLLPYTIGKTQSPENMMENRAELRATNQVRKWYMTGGKELYENPRYGTAALFLAPRDGEYSPGAWKLVSATLGLRTERSFDSFIREAYAAKGQFQHYATMSDYQDEIAQFDPLTSEGRQEIKKRDEKLSLILAENFSDNPYWELKWAEENNSAAVQEYAKRLLPMTTNLVNDLKDQGKDTPESRSIRSAIMTYNDFVSRYDTVQGNTRADQDYKRELRLTIRTLLDEIAESNPNAELFIKNVLRPLIPRGTGV